MVPDTRTMRVIQQLLTQNLAVQLQVHGPSMFPVIRSGASASIDPWHGTPRITPGAIILFQQHNRLTLHRLIRHDPHTNLYITTGDAALRGTEPIPASNVIGIARTVTHGTKTRRLDSRPARYLGLILFYTRPLRRLIDRLWFQHRSNL